jgi:hypothetical protein
VLNFLKLAISLRWGDNLFRQRLLFVLYRSWSTSFSSSATPHWAERS